VPAVVWHSSCQIMPCCLLLFFSSSRLLLLLIASPFIQLTNSQLHPTNQSKQPQMAQQAEAAAAKAKLEAQVDAAALPVMELPAPPLPQPSVLEGTMRPYQLQGLSWLVIEYARIIF